MLPTAITIVQKLQKAGYETYFAGGCVRDILLKREPKDYDIVTAAKPDTVEDLLEKTIPVGKQFGVIQAIENGHHFEIATFREDSKRSDGRRPHTISFASAKEDAKRRDFTINGMFYNPITEDILDYVGGKNDINEHLIRFIGDPEERIQEDHLRILRAIRFKNTFDFQYHPDTFQALKKHAQLVKNISPERIRDELNKIIALPHSLKVFEDLEDTRVLHEILPEVEKMKGVAQPHKYHQEGDVWTHSLMALESLSPKCPLALRWAVLLHDSGKPDTFEVRDDRIHFDGHAELSSEIAQNILKRLNFSNAEIEEVCWLIDHHMMMTAFEKMTKRRRLQWYQKPHFKKLLRLMQADIMGSKPRNFSLLDSIKDDYKTIIKEAHRPKPKPLLTGADLIKKMKLEEGPLVGDILKEVEKLHVEEKIHTKKEAWDIARDMINQKKKRDS